MMTHNIRSYGFFLQQIYGKTIEWRKLAQIFFSFFSVGNFIMLLWDSSCGIFVWADRFFVDLVVAGNFHGFLELELEFFEWFLLLLV
jgi:hypothetical protein